MKVAFPVWVMCGWIFALGCEAAPDRVGESAEPIIDGLAAYGKSAKIVHASVGVLTTFGRPHCSGTLIGPRVVLTAAHCFSGPSTLAFSTGEYSSTSKKYAPKPSGVDLTPFSHVHPDYKNGAHDLAYVVLDEDVTGVPAASVGLHKGREFCNFDVVGYGRTKEGHATNELSLGFHGERKTATICVQGTEPGNAGVLVAKGQNGSTCHGDSGGGLLVKGKTNDPDTLVGVVRGGRDNGTCRTGEQLLFTSLEGEDAFLSEALAAGEASKAAAKQ